MYGEAMASQLRCVLRSVGVDCDVTVIADVDFSEVCEVDTRTPAAPHICGGCQYRPEVFSDPKKRAYVKIKGIMRNGRYRTYLVTPPDVHAVDVTLTLPEAVEQCDADKLMAIAAGTLGAPEMPVHVRIAVRPRASAHAAGTAGDEGSPRAFLMSLLVPLVLLALLHARSLVFR